MLCRGSEQVNWTDKKQTLGTLALSLTETRCQVCLFVKRMNRTRKSIRQGFGAPFLDLEHEPRGFLFDTVAFTLIGQIPVPAAGTQPGAKHMAGRLRCTGPIGDRHVLPALAAPVGSRTGILMQIETTMIRT